MCISTSIQVRFCELTIPWSRYWAIASSTPFLPYTAVLLAVCPPAYSTSSWDLHHWFCSSLALSCGDIATGQNLPTEIMLSNKGSNVVPNYAIAVVFISIVDSWMRIQLVNLERPRFRLRWLWQQNSSDRYVILENWEESNCPDRQQGKPWQSPTGQLMPLQRSTLDF